jgi:chaperonin cofactor prefoldin
VFKQVGGVLIDQTKKEVKTTLSNRVALIKNQIEHTNDLLKNNEQEQKKMAEKIQKAKERYYEMAQKLQPNA